MRWRIYIAMKTDTMATKVLSSDFKKLGEVAEKLANHAIKLGSLGFKTSFFTWIASFETM